MLTNEEIVRTWLAASDVHTAGEKLINEAKERGGHDNITVGIVRIANEGEAETSRSVRVTREIEVA